MPAPEEPVHQNIDLPLTSASWIVQDRSSINLHAARDVAEAEAVVVETGLVHAGRLRSVFEGRFEFTREV